MSVLHVRISSQLVAIIRHAYMHAGLVEHLSTAINFSSDDPISKFV